MLLNQIHKNAMQFCFRLYNQIAIVDMVQYLQMALQVLSFTNSSQNPVLNTVWFEFDNFQAQRNVTLA